MGDVLYKVVFTKAGQATKTYGCDTTNRILQMTHPESEWSQTAEIVVDNRDGNLTALDLTGYTATISYGYHTTSDEYSACAPLEVISQKQDTLLGQSDLITTFSCAGVFNMMEMEEAQAEYVAEYSALSLVTVKTILTRIAEATFMPCFYYSQAYTITFDSEDTLIDTFIPGDNLTIGRGESRLSAFKKALGWTGCKARIEDDGAIHIFVPKTAYVRYEYNDSGASAGWRTYGDIWNAQTFTPSTSHTITRVRLPIYRFGSPGTITVSITATDGSGHPTGSDLCSGTTDGDTLATGSPYAWREIDLGAGTSLTASTKYAILVKVLSGDSSNHILWRYRLFGEYDGGNFEYSNDGGSSWSSAIIITWRDFMFEEWGDESYDYEYNDNVTGHNFFQKSVRNRLTIPNRVNVKSLPYQDGQYWGSAVDSTSYSALGRYIDEFHWFRVTSNDQCSSIATTILESHQMGQESGYGYAPLNCGQEVMDFVKITDSVANDTRTGSIGYLNRITGLVKFEFEFRFGDILLGGLAGVTLPQVPTYSEGATEVLSLASKVDLLTTFYNRMADIINGIREDVNKLALFVSALMVEAQSSTSVFEGQIILPVIISGKPVVTTQAVTSIASTTATGNGNIKALGVPASTTHGVCWNTTGAPTTADDKTDEGAVSETGAFTSAMTGLITEATYYVRAYATNIQGTTYGIMLPFTTTA